ncbi:unnamed protein product [Merluccius merluccius]
MSPADVTPYRSQVTSDLPKVSSDLPQVTSDLPQVTSGLPQVTFTSDGPDTALTSIDSLFDRNVAVDGSTLCWRSFNRLEVRDT